MFTYYSIQPMKMGRYGVYLTKRQLEEDINQSCRSPMRLIRNLSSVFTPPIISCLGTRKYQDLDKDVIGVCLRNNNNYN